MNVLITGAGGSIGSRLCELIQCDSLTLLSLTENGLYNIGKTLAKKRPELDRKLVLGSVRDEKLLNEILPGIDVVIHAAAHKHVPICESNPLEAIENNVRGTQTLVRAAKNAGVKRFVLISTDKAVNPACIMGATKRVAEMLVRANSCSDMRCIVTRFGNVIDSAGSVLPLWREQLETGGPITVTDSRCTRYFMTIEEACTLVLSVLRLPEQEIVGSPIFVFEMGKPKRLIDIAYKLMRDTGLSCDIRFIGLRPGEKLEEELYKGTFTLTSIDKVYRVADEGPSDGQAWIEEDLLQACAARNEELAKSLLWDIVKR